jgi:putative spermidine/putrescine transport system permease protein
MAEISSTGDTSSVDTGLLKKQLRRSERAKKATSLALIAPLFFYLLINFLLPVAFLLYKSIDDQPVTAVLQQTTRVLSDWDGEGQPDAAAYAALIADLQAAYKAKRQNIAAKRLNTAIPGFHAMISKTVRRLARIDPASPKETLIKIDKRWGQRKYWAAIKQTADRFTPIYLLAAFDLTLDSDGRIARAPEYMRLFNKLWLRTFWMSLVITVVCILLGYPLAYLLANVPTRISNLLMILVLLPFWTSLLVRTTAWVVLLQTQGVINDVAVYLHLWTDRIQLIHNRTGVYFAMAHILLPYIVLPLFGIMRRISPNHIRAAKSLGANPFVAFWRVYFPQTVHGIGAGALFVFILALGFWVTPALVGGRNDQMISYFIAYFTNETLHWGQATALGVVLLFFMAIVFFIFRAVFGLNKLQTR